MTCTKPSKCRCAEHRDATNEKQRAQRAKGYGQPAVKDLGLFPNGGTFTRSGLAKFRA